jgi:hypothetical protein
MYIQSTGLLDLSGLSNVVVVNDLTILNNDSMTAIGLESLQSVTGDLEIRQNANLLDCHADALLSQLPAAPASTQIENNGGPGACN